MSDVVTVALISASFPAVVAVVAAVASIFGPTWRDASQRRAESEAAREDLRYQRALDFIDALTEASGYTLDSGHGRASQRAWTKFVATLRKGEGAAEVFTREMRSADLATIDKTSGTLFAWLRGEIPTNELSFPTSGK